MEDNASVTIRALVGKNVRRIRSARGISAEDLAKSLAFSGLSWTPARVSELESGRKAVGIAELLLLAEALGDQSGPVGLADLLESEKPVELASNVSLRPKALTAAFTGAPVEWTSSDIYSPNIAYRFNKLSERLSDFQADVSRYLKGDHSFAELRAAEASAGSADAKAAKTVGLTQNEFLGAAVSLWGTSMTAERNRRAGESETKQARGHVSRQMMKEMRDYLEKFNGDD